jgi:lipoprotein-anchoring transpeptidase ErfK/SrfK
MALLYYGEKIRRLWGNRSVLIAGGGLLLLLALVALWIFAARPPIATFEQARVALHHARVAEANRYAPVLLQAAEKRWEQATQAWQRENKKWFLWRDFQATLKLAEAARLQAQDAASTATATRDSLQFVAAAELAMIKQNLDEFKQRFAHLPVAAPLRRKCVAGEILMIESRLAFDREDYWQAVARVQQAAALAGSAGDGAARILQTYLARVPEWKQWAAETIQWSAQQNAAAIVVDKMAHRCYLYLNGVLKAEYTVELGPRWLGHKRQRGDNATPEGHYHVTKKKSRGQTKYYKALEIDYPNENDRQQFGEAKKTRVLPRSAQIGGLIELHGAGGKGVNWTSGCVALRNQDMDVVFDLVSIGARVTIVGSLHEKPSLALSSSNLPAGHLNGKTTPSVSSQ